MQKKHLCLKPGIMILLFFFCFSFCFFSAIYAADVSSERVPMNPSVIRDNSQPITDYPPPIIHCEKDYECLYNAIAGGRSARVINTETIKSLSLIETSEVLVEPLDRKYKVTMTVLNLKAEKNEMTATKSVLDSVAETCPEIAFNLSRIISTSAVCYAGSPQEARSLAIEGLSDESIRKYSCKGDLINKIRVICSYNQFHGFPYGVKKPAIYLYPTQKRNINVTLQIKGVITKSEPAYASGWSVTAEPDGLIDGKYEYLFYEVQLEKLNLPVTGWIVEYKELEQWFDINLIKLGLNEKEKSQFKEYWLKELPGANYYELRLLENAFLKENMDLSIDPEPDTLIRLNFYFRALSQKKHIVEPEIITPVRKGFTIVEWGGLLEKQK